MSTHAPSHEPLAGDDPRFAEVDRAIASEDAERAGRREARRAAVARFDALPRLLRWIGASVLVVAAFTFMLQSWQQGDDIGRYFHFVGFTAALTLAGFFCGLRIRDEKSARTFLGLAVGAVPVHFTVLGALLYSQFPWLSGFTDYPAYAHFSAPDQAAALATTAVGLAALVPVCWIAFLAFARPQAWRLTLGYLVANAALLVPTRHPDVIGLLALALLIGTALFDRLALRAGHPMRTPEGRFARALMAVPFAVLIGRTLNLYDPSALFFAAVFASLAVVLFVLAPAATRSRFAAVTAQYGSLIPVTLAWLCVLHALLSAFPFGREAALPLLCLPLALGFFAMSLRAVDGGASMRRLATLVATGGMTLQLVWFPGVLSSFACLATAIVAAAHGYAAQQRGIFVTGLAALAFGLLYHLRYAAELYALSPWGSLAILGIATVIAASLLERHHRALFSHFSELKGRMRAWSA